MKKMLMTVAALAVIWTLGTTAAFAEGPSASTAESVSAVQTGGKTNHPAAGGNCAFVDADNDGICDNLDTHCNFVDANGDGICDNRDTHCTSFVDADNDGICDNCKNLCTHNSASHSNDCAHNGIASVNKHRSDSHGHGRRHH